MDANLTVAVGMFEATARWIRPRKAIAVARWRVFCCVMDEITFDALWLAVGVSQRMKPGHNGWGCFSG